MLASPCQHHGAQQQRLHAWGENRITRLDGIFAVTQLVRQADLPEIGMTLLRAIQVGDPDARPVARHRLGDHTGGTAVAHHPGLRRGKLWITT